MDGQLYIVPGDVTQLTADAIAYSSNNSLSGGGALHPAFCANVPGFAPWLDELRRQHRAVCKVGDTFWLTLAADRKPHGVVVVVATGAGPEREDKAGTAVRAALGAAVQHLRTDLRRTGRLLIALPAFRVGMGGDRRHRLRSARAQVETALAELKRHPDVDAAFVTYTPALYHIFLEARRQVLGAPPADAALPPALAHSLLAGECVLFVGAGLSRSTGLPDWSELIARLARDLKIAGTDRLDYLDLAQWYRDRFGGPALAEVIRETFANPYRTPLPTLAHYLLLSLPVRLVLTTNYDDLVERSLAALKRFPTPVVRQEDVARIGQGSVSVVKLHGDAARAEEIVLSRDDYDEFFERRPAMALLLEGLLLNQTFFFVGYGLRDPNFRQLFSRIGRMLREARRPAFATTFEGAGESGAYLFKQWERKQLQLIGIPGTSPEEQERQLFRFLDRLSEQVALAAPRLVLAPDVEVAAQLAGLRDLLAGRVGDELEKIAQADLAGPDGPAVVPFLAQLLEFLAHHGWRPGKGKGWELCRLWERLAAQTPDVAGRRRRLIAALASAEGFADVQRIREQLAALDKGSK